MEDTPELQKELTSEYKKIKVNQKEDDDTKVEVDTLALKLAEDPANADKQVTSHEEIVKILKKKKKRVCWSCRRINCLTRQTCGNKLKLRKQYLGDCKGKPITFKESKDSRPAKNYFLHLH